MAHCQQLVPRRAIACQGRHALDHGHGHGRQAVGVGIVRQMLTGDNIKATQPDDGTQTSL